MKTRRVLALVPEGMAPPEDIEGLSYEEIAPWKMEYDVLQALRHHEHDVQLLDVGFDLGPIRDAIEEFKPHICFNMLEEFHGQVGFDHNVVAWLELMRARYTGCNARGLVLARDKALAKKIFTYHRIRTPKFQVFPRGRRVRLPKRLQYPLFVKSVVEDASMGISQASVVRNDEQLQKRVAWVHDQTDSAALVEEYIEGRELYLSLLGNRRLQTFPLWEIVLDNLPDSAERVATRRIKFDVAYQEKYSIETRRARDLPDGLEERIHKMGKRMYRVLGLSGYARIDLRYRESDQQIYVLEANPNPDLSSDEDYALSCEAGGLEYEDLIQRIVSLGLSWRPGF